MGISVREIDLAALPPTRKMELADALYDAAQVEMDALTPILTREQQQEIDRRLAAAAG